MNLSPKLKRSLIIRINKGGTSVKARWNTGNWIYMYSLTHQVDWDSALRNDAGVVNKLGLYDLDRKIMPVGKAYKNLIMQWKDILEEESYGFRFLLL